MNKLSTATVCFFGFLLLPALIFTTSVHGEDPLSYAKGELESLTKIYRHLHMNPELSFQEKNTMEYMAGHMKRAGLKVTTNVGGFGVVGILENGRGPTVMLRADLDALPVTESTGLVYSSKVKVKEGGKTVGVMHACGHDVHMTNLIGTINYLTKNKDRWSGTLMAIGQPAEERGGGAAAMLKDGLFEKFPKPDFAIALHVDSTLAAGNVSVRAGFALANVDSVDVTLYGKGGHGAAPHTAVDPIVQAAQLVLQLQTIVSREIKPTEPAVITVGSIHGGTKHNIIGDSCHLQITIRSYASSVREKLLSGIKRKAKAVAMGAKAKEPKIEISEGTPSLYNDDELTQRIVPVIKRTIGSENVYQAEQVMGGEDFSRYGRAGVPILMYRLGVVQKRKLDRFKELGQSPPSLHSAVFYPDFEESIATGIASMSEAAIELMKK